MKALLLVLAATAGCLETTPYQTTPLDGSIGCASATCADDQVCVEEAPGGASSCFTVPSGCYIFNCSGKRCAPCVQALCSTEPVEVNARNVYCPAP